jgi:hypothetical protein
MERECKRPGWIFSRKVVEQFSHLNGMTLVAKAHQLVHEEYSIGLMRSE